MNFFLNISGHNCELLKFSLEERLPKSGEKKGKIKFLSEALGVDIYHILKVYIYGKDGV